MESGRLLMPRWTLAGIPFLLPDANTHISLVFVRLSDPLTIVGQSLLCILAPRSGYYLLLYFLINVRRFLHL